MTRHQPPGAAALDSARLPRFTFIAGDGTEDTVAVSSQTARIRAVAQYLGAKVPRGTVTGLVYRSGRELVTNWLACLVAGLRPLVLHYPARRQGHAYWAESIRNTLDVARIGAIVADASCAAILRENAVAVTIISQDGLANLRARDASAFSLSDFSVIQLSSGMTGHRKAIEFGAQQIFTHMRDLNASLGLTAQDRIASWLPLSHNMGLIACFVMPMLMGIDVVMIDAIAWNKQPELLFDAIARHGATVCTMPNFGFEAMAREETRALQTMRWWICGSEPVSAQTLRKFASTTGADPDSLACLYGMAETVLAASIRRGIATREIDGAEIVSCGAPIANAEIKAIDGELWVKSPSSFAAYMDGADIRDADGFFPTGDLGRIIDGEVYVTGRKHDLVIQAGRKFMLGDIDLALNRLFPWTKGRAAAVRVHDERLGTEKPQLLIETGDFFLRRDQGDIAKALREATGLDHLAVEFVPPRFLTKAASGAFDRRKSAADWLLAKQARADKAAGADPVAELRETFAHAGWETPVKDALDSLSQELLRIVLTGTGVGYNGARTLTQYATRLAARKDASDTDAPDTIRIVSLADRRTFENLSADDIKRIARKLDARVTFEHICLPPSPIVLSDLIFHDWFQPRAQSGNFTAIGRAFETLKSASIILVDDTAEMLIGGGQAPGALSHDLKRDPACDRIAYRWQRYARYHDTLPLTFVSGADLGFAHRTKALDMLGAYLRTPIFKIALVPSLEAFTQEWELRGESENGELDPNDFVRAFLKWTRKGRRPLKRHPSRETQTIVRNDLDHFSAQLVDARAVDTLVSKFDRFCIAGPRSSVPYLRNELDRLGKPYVYTASYAKRAMATLPQDYDCLVICGPQGAHALDKPAVALIRASEDWRVINTDDPDLRDMPLAHGAASHPESGTDWFYPFPLDRAANLAHHDLVLESGQAERARKKRRGRDV